MARGGGGDRGAVCAAVRIDSRRMVQNDNAPTEAGACRSAVAERGLRALAAHTQGREAAAEQEDRGRFRN